MHAQWLCTLRYNIKGSVATSRAMPTPFFFSRLPEALRGLMTKQTFRAYITQKSFYCTHQEFTKVSEVLLYFEMMFSGVHARGYY